MSDETRHDWSDDDAFAAFLRRNADAYNPPPETPVDAIWEGIREARKEREANGGVVPIASRRWLMPVLAVAAVLVLGIAIGRISMRQAAERDGAVGPAVATRTETPPDRPAVVTGSPDGPTGAVDSALAPIAPEETDRFEAPAGDLAAAGTRDAGRDPRPGRPAAGAERPEPAPEGPDRPETARDLYRLASVQMLAQAEVLLIDFRSGRAAGREGSEEVGRWARNVLSSTRLLLDSPAGRDPEMRVLLEDLELVLAQIVRHTGADPIEGEMIDRTIEERDLIPRLRSAMPAGGASI